MSAAREKTQADFDLERFIDMFDEALTSKDERVINALRSLMMMVILTKPESSNFNGDVGPLRQLYDDLHNMNRRQHDTEERLRQVENQLRNTREYTRAESATDYWNRQYGQTRWSAVDPMTLPTISEQDYKLAMMKINGTSKI